jgi:hypothetical protein
MRLYLGALALCTLAFQPVHMASNDFYSGSDAFLIISPGAKLHGNSSSVLNRIKIISPMLKLFETDCLKLLKTVFEINPEDSSDCLKFLRSLDGDIESVVADIRANYSAIGSRMDLWDAVSKCMGEALHNLSLDHFKEIGAKEALNYSIVLMAFNSTNERLLKSWEELEKLSKAFVIEQWTLLADWAIYVSRPTIYTLPPHIFQTSHFSNAQWHTIMQTVRDVILFGEAFEQNGFFRPKCEVPNLEAIEIYYVFVVVRHIDWDKETMQLNRRLLGILFEVLTFKDKIFAQVIRDLIPSLCAALYYIQKDLEFLTLAIDVLISDSILGILTGNMHPEEELEDKNNVKMLIATAFSVHEAIFKKALEKLNSANKALAVSTVVAVKAARTPSSLLEKIAVQLGQLQNCHLPEDCDRLSNGGNAIIGLLKHFPPNWGADPKRSIVSDQTEDLMDIFDSELVKHAIPISLQILQIRSNFMTIRYVLASLEHKPRFAADLVYSFGNLLRCANLSESEFESESESNGLSAKETCVERMERTHKVITTHISRETLCSIFLEACVHINSLKRFSCEELRDTIIFATFIWDIKRLSKYIISLSATHLTKSAILDGDFSVGATFRVHGIGTSVCMAAITAWRANPSKRSARHMAAFKAFISWAIANNHVPRSIALILKIAFN